MIRIRYWVRLFSTFLEKFKSVLVVSAVLGIAVFVVAPRAKILLSFLGSGENIGLVGRYSTDDIPFEIQRLVSKGLTQVDETGEVSPGLADTWYAEDDGRVWVFTLGEYYWQDGTRVKAKDINYQFSDVSSEVIDEFSLKFTFKDPFSPFPSIVSRPVFKRGLLGAGEWRVAKVSYINNNFIQLLRLVNVDSGSRKTFRFYPTENAARTAFKLGEIDQIQDLVDIKDLGSWENTQITPVFRTDRYVGIFLNTQDDVLSGKSVRQALAYAIDKTQLGHERAIGPISPNSWAYNPQVKQYLYNPQKAKDFLDDLPKEQLESLSINLVTTPGLLSVADKVKSYWEAVGVTTNLQVSNTPPEDFQALLAIQAIPQDPDQYSFWHSTQTATNITNYSNSKESQRIDKLLEDGRRILDKEERKQIYVDFQRFLVEESPVIFLHHPTTYTVVRR